MYVLKWEMTAAYPFDIADQNLANDAVNNYWNQFWALLI